MTAGQYIDVPSLARVTLDGVIAHFAAAGVELPERRVIAPGEPRQIAWDCESVICACAGISWGQGPGTGSGTSRRTGNPVSVGARYTVLTVQIVRWVPEFDGTNPPPEDELTDAGIELMTDAGMLSQALVELCGKSGAFQRAGVAVAGAVVILGPAGGYCACEGNLTITAGSLV